MGGPGYRCCRHSLVRSFNATRAHLLFSHCRTSQVMSMTSFHNGNARQATSYCQQLWT